MEQSSGARRKKTPFCSKNPVPIVRTSILARKVQKDCDQNLCLVLPWHPHFRPLRMYGCKSWGFPSGTVESCRFMMSTPMEMSSTDDVWDPKQPQAHRSFERTWRIVHTNPILWLKKSDGRIKRMKSQIEKRWKTYMHLTWYVTVCLSRNCHSSVTVGGNPQVPHHAFILAIPDLSSVLIIYHIFYICRIMQFQWSHIHSKVFYHHYGP